MMAALSVHNMTKRFGSYAALDDVSIDIERGKIHALLGENGAGKSTLGKCIIGLYSPDEGRIEFDGKTVVISGPDQAQKQGLGMVHQHYSLVPSLTVLENFVLARGACQLLIDWSAERLNCQKKLSGLPFKVDLDRLVSQLSAGEKQRIEIVKQLYLETRILILDEPTSVLTPQEADEILSFVRQLVSVGGHSAILITHKLREVIAYADTLHVLRKGRLVAEGPVIDYSAEELANIMVGESIPKQALPSKTQKKRDTVLRIIGLSAKDQRGADALKGIDLDLVSGEILGVAGVSGNGQRELMEVLCGQRLHSGGKITVGGSPYRATRRDQRKLGFRLLPEEPLQNAGIGDMTVAENLMMRNFDEPPYAKGSYLRPGRFRAAAGQLISRFSIHGPGPDAPLSVLSGGNIQRVMLARELSEETKVLAIANPCHGLDIKAIASVHQRLIDLRQRGGAVLLISEDLDEILSLSDRVAVMFEGRIVAVLGREEADRSHIGRLMTGHG
ncbi:ABC transporter ATP-binding protein [Phyllobacterium endophyticum]|uniref:ABC transporter ATP-binding protein n=1 Tax=Phyllobacterium endophyticum TaxID=1149773 RepID=UPI0011CCC1CE|nr:ABC transporter ATP-binding protein [Phyllobacterium endophyticum]TXR47051.1 ABC transporter ATP-binding protein [Phyllobacterium endophyticum]